MTELTGLESILERSHFKTERKHKYSFGKSHRFTPLKSSYPDLYLDIRLIFSINRSRETREHVLLVTEANTFLYLHLTILVLQSMSYQDKKYQEYHSV